MTATVLYWAGHDRADFDVGRMTDICSQLKDEHFADELHPNDAGAKMIADEVFRVLGNFKAAG
jgi:hypothetical protein